MRTQALAAIHLARLHMYNGAVMASSAQLCFYDACHQYATGNDKAALMWAIKSLAYSVGIFHEDYKRANQTPVPAEYQPVDGKPDCTMF